MERVEVWKASDGTTFETKFEAEVHEETLRQGELVEMFSNWYVTQGKASTEKGVLAGMTRAKNIVVAWEVYRRQAGLDQ